MSKNPLLSIVTPSFNQGRFIKKNIQSVLSQDYKNFEHIVVDGKSSDNTVSVLKKFSHLKWVSEKDNGQSHALNKGFRMAKGEIIGWLNSDDYYEKNVFSRVAVAFSDPKAMVVFGNCNYVDQNGNFVFLQNSRFVSFSDWYRFWSKKSVVPQPSVFFRKNLLEELGYLDESLHYSMDFDLFCRFFRKHTPKHLPFVVANFRLHPESKTVSQQENFLSNGFWLESKKVSQKYWGFWDFFSFNFYRTAKALAFFFAKMKRIILRK